MLYNVMIGWAGIESPKPKHQAPERPNQTLIRPLRDRNQTLHQTTEKLKPNLCYFGYLYILIIIRNLKGIGNEKIH